MRYDRLLEGKRALITGRAYGVNRACAEEFARHGAEVLTADAVGERDIEAPDIWLNTAGVFGLGFVDRLSEDDIAEAMRHNVIEPMCIMKRLAPAMMERRRGSVIQVLGEYALTGYNAASVYAASLGGLRGMTDALAANCAPYGIRVNCLLLGAGAGPAAEIETAGMTPEEEKRRWGTVNPLWRRADDGEIARAALFLASDLSGYITGEAILLDGGQRVVSHKEIYRKAGWAG